MTKSTNTKFTPEQQAAINKDRAAAKKAKAAAAPTVEPVEATPVDEATVLEQLKALSFKELIDRIAPVDVTMFSWKRRLAAFFLVCALSYGAGYAIGWVASYAVVGIMTLTGSALLSWMVIAIAVLLSMYAGYKIGQHVGNYVLTGQLDRDIYRGYDKVKGWFGAAKDKLVPAKA